MRLSDQPGVDVDIWIAAPVDTVWALVSDMPRMGEWSPECKGGQWLDPAAGPAVGSRFRGRQQHPAIGEWESESVIVEAEAGRALVWAVGDPANAGATWRFDLEEEGGGTRLRQHVTIGPGPSGLTMAIERMPDKEQRIIERRLEEHRGNMEATLAAIKATAES